MSVEKRTKKEILLSIEQILIHMQDGINKDSNYYLLCDFIRIIDDISWLVTEKRWEKDEAQGKGIWATTDEAE